MFLAGTQYNHLKGMAFLPRHQPLSPRGAPLAAEFVEPIPAIDHFSLRAEPIQYAATFLLGHSGFQQLPVNLHRLGTHMLGRE